MESLVKNDNYVLIQGWMLNELGLKNNELLVYAIIHGFSQTNGTEFNGSLQYLANWCNCTKRNIIKCLNSLIEKKFIIKSESYMNGIKFCSYRINHDILNPKGGGEKSSPGGEKSSPNNIDNNINNNIDLERDKEREHPQLNNYDNLKETKQHIPIEYIEY